MPETILSALETKKKTTEAISGAGGSPLLFGDYEVSENVSWASPVIAVERLIFNSNSRLYFDHHTVRRNSNLFIFAKEIISADPEQLGEITWIDIPPSEPPIPGEGSSGIDNGSHENTPGGEGGTGPSGIKGEDGYPAPSLTMIIGSLRGGLKVSLVGENGGTGGKGGTGGRGGQGGYGTPASQNPFNCTRGAGDGAVGGRGGKGGQGGKGGNGGNGGTFTLITQESNIAVFTRLLKVDVSGGQPGQGGTGGLPGNGGPGGPGGREARPWCVGNGSNGPNGSDGLQGEANIPGIVGNAGVYYVGGLSVDDIQKILK